MSRSRRETQKSLYKDDWGSQNPHSGSQPPNPPNWYRRSIHPIPSYPIMVNTSHLCALATLVASTMTSVVAAPPSYRRNAIQLEVCGLSHPIETADDRTPYRYE